ncbi:MAG: alpha/beta hydrolase [Rhodospirillaceae bacterium]|nr:alpha/beta hydrolase [Rhodospirillaceae bacterium]
MTATYDPTAQFDIDVSEEIYRSGPDGDWPVRLYRPQGDGPFPVLLDVHGGAWSNGSYLNNEDVDRALAASGILVAAIEFRQAPEHVYPAQVADVNYGTRWLKARAADLGGDPATLGALGTSSGGHSLMLSVLKPSDPRYAAETLAADPSADATVRYAINGWPVLDSHARYLYARDAGVERLMKSSENYFGDEDTMREGNPQLVLERGEQTALPPALILQGTKDDNVPLAISERFVATYESLGGSIERVLFSDMPHAFTREPGPETDRAIQLMKSFIAEQLKDR